MKSIETKVTYFLQIIFSFSLTAHSANLIYNFFLLHNHNCFVFAIYDKRGRKVTISISLTSQMQPNNMDQDASCG